MIRPVTPVITVDIIIELIDRDDRPIVLIERRNPPPGWALPGGFVDVGETLEHAAVREAEEEINLTVNLQALLGCYSDPARDPRGHTISAVYIAEATGDPRAQDDAKAVMVVPLTAIPQRLAFDHDLILQDYLKYRHEAKPVPLRG